MMKKVLVVFEHVWIISMITLMTVESGALFAYGFTLKGIMVLSAALLTTYIYAEGSIDFDSWGRK